MFGTTRGMLIPARKAPAGLPSRADRCSAPIAARADDGMVDVRTLPRLEGAVEELAAHRILPLELRRSDRGRRSRPPATRKLLAADGWSAICRSRSRAEPARSMSFKKGQQGLCVSLHARPRQARPIRRVLHRRPASTPNVPFPHGCDRHRVRPTRRPYLSCISAADGRGEPRFLPQGDCWRSAGRHCRRPISRRAGRMPSSARRSQTARAPITATTSRRRRLPAAADHADAAAPRRRQDRRRNQGSRRLRCRRISRSIPRRDRPAETEITPRASAGTGSSEFGPPQGRRRTVIAEIPVVLAFYRRELAARNWKEEANGAVITDRRRHAEFFLRRSRPPRSGSATNTTSRSSTSSTQVKEAALAARAKAKKEADDKFFSGCGSRPRSRSSPPTRCGGPPRPPTCRMRRCARSPTTPSRCRCRRAPKT